MRQVFQFAAIVLSLALSFISASCTAHRSTGDSFLRTPDGKQWLTENLNLAAAESYCYADAATNCRRYGRLYTWESGQRACQSLGDGWRLPADDDWRQLASQHGGIFDDSGDGGRTAYNALSMGGRSGFDALLGGGRVAGEYEDLDAHGFYWTASEDDPATALFYNFGRGSLALFRQPEGDKQMALSVRCVRSDG